MKVFLYQNGEKITFASEGKGGFIGDAPDIEGAKEKARQMYAVHCIASSFLNFKKKASDNKDYKPTKEDCIMPEEIDFIIINKTI